VGRPLRRAYATLPGLQRLVRAGIYTLHEGLVPGMIRDPRLLRLQEATAAALLRRQVPDPDLRARVTPHYPIGCKRILLSNEWYPMLCRPNVELVPEPIGGVDRGAVLTEGARREVDVIIFATGFAATDLPISHRVVGRDGRPLAEVWGGSPQAHLGTTVAGFPNLFLLYGPNTNLGHSSIIYMLESQFRYVLGALAAMRSRALATLEVRPAAQAAWQARVQRRLGRSVWNSGCASWYLDANGTNSTMWPGFTFEFRRRTRRFDLDNYLAEARSPVGPTPALQGA
jgi:cation diffusion facilitator CzcD-associated flavoprotein CzcO